MPEQRGAAVTLRQMTWNESSICGSAVVENRANVPVAALRFVAFAMPRRGSHEPGEEAMLTSEWLAVDVEPGATATIDVAIRRRVGEFLAGIYQGRMSAAYPAYPEGPLARTHFIIGRDGGATPPVDTATTTSAFG